MRNRTLLIVLIMGLFSGLMFAQNVASDIEIGDVFVIAEVENDNYKHIDFPKTNFIIKKGGIADYDKVVGKQVEVTSLKEKKDGTVIATIKLTSEKSFFNSHKYVTVDISEALKNKELKSI